MFAHLLISLIKASQSSEAKSSFDSSPELCISLTCRPESPLCLLESKLSLDSEPESIATAPWGARILGGILPPVSVEVSSASVSSDSIAKCGLTDGVFGRVPSSCPSKQTENDERSVLTALFGLAY